MTNPLFIWYVVFFYKQTKTFTCNFKFRKLKQCGATAINYNP